MAEKKLPSDIAKMSFEDALAELEQIDFFALLDAALVWKSAAAVMKIEIDAPPTEPPGAYEIAIERKGLDSITKAELQAAGHILSPQAGYFGDIQLIVRQPTGIFYGASDSRREGGRALGY